MFLSSSAIESPVTTEKAYLNWTSGQEVGGMEFSPWWLTLSPALLLEDPLRRKADTPFTQCIVFQLPSFLPLFTGSPVDTTTPVHQRKNSIIGSHPQNKTGKTNLHSFNSWNFPRMTYNHLDSKQLLDWIAKHLEDLGSEYLAKSCMHAASGFKTHNCQGTGLIKNKN